MTSMWDPECALAVAAHELLNFMTTFASASVVDHRPARAAAPVHRRSAHSR